MIHTYIQFSNFFRMIINIENELEKLISPLNLAMEHIEQYKKELMSDHITRQTKIWEFTIKQKLKSNNTDTATSEISEQKPVFLLGNAVKSKDDYGTPISLDKPLHFILGDVKHSSMESNSSYHSTCESPIPPKNYGENILLEPDTNTVNNTPINIQNSVELYKFTSTSLAANNDNQNFLGDELPMKNIQRTLETIRNDVSVQDKSNLNNNEAPVTFDLTRNNKTVSNVPSVCVPNFLIGAPATDMININTSLRYE